MKTAFALGVRALSVLALTLALPGCPFISWGGDDDGDDDYGYSDPGPRTPTPAPTGRIAPSITRIELPAYPPLGAEGVLTIECEDEIGLTSLQTMFRGPSYIPLTGKKQTVTLHASELGEGYGLLQLRLNNTRNAYTERAVENLLIDMTPPEVMLETASVSPKLAGAEVVLWVQDQWALGFVELSFKGKTFRHDFPALYPSTLGTAWDVSRVSFPAAEFPEGTTSATIVVGDAAGNRASREVRLVVDGTAPTVSMQQPTPGQHVGAHFDIAVTATDSKSTTPVSVDLFVGGSLVGTLLGPNGSLRVDTTSLPKGEVEVEAVAYDEAGNMSEQTMVTVIVD